MAKTCLNCHKDGCTLSCSGCKLPGIYYCSKDCQISNWKTQHKVDCKLAKQFDLEQTKLSLNYDRNDTKNKDYDAVLSFAKRYMKNVTQLDIRLRQAGMWEQSDMTNMTSFGPNYLEPLIKFTYDVLRDYLESVPLVSFEMHCEECIDMYVAIMTKQGKAFQPLTSSTTLRRFAITGMPIKKISRLPLTPHLKYLQISMVKFTTWDGPMGWKPDKTQEIVSLISNMTELETLRFYSVPINDGHLELLLSNLCNLRHLEISGTFGTTNLSRANIGQVTDQGCQIIARLLPNLQSLGLDYQPTITKRGAGVVLRTCQHLRDLSLEYACLSAADLIDLLSLNQSKLLIFSFGQLTGQQTATNFAKASMKATGGRTLIRSGFAGLVQPDGLSDREKRQWAHSKQLCDYVFETQDERYNIWEPLWGVNATID